MKTVLIIYNIPKGIESEFEPQIDEYVYAIKKNNLAPLPISADKALQYVEINKDNISFVIYIDKDIYLANSLSNMGIKVFNSAEAIAFCDDKALTYSQLILHKIPTPNTYVLPYTFGKNLFDQYPNILYEIKEKGFNFPFVIKERRGSFGDQVYLVKSVDEFNELIQKVGTKSLLVQEFIEEAFGTDYRINVVGKKVICGVMRQNKTNFKSNIHQGGVMIPLGKINKEIQKIAVMASQAVHASFSGVDIIQKRDGTYLVLEVNSNSRTIAVSKATGVPLASFIVEYCIRKSRMLN